MKHPIVLTLVTICLGAVAITACGDAAAEQAATRTVSTSDQLMKAVAAAKPGDVIAVAPGRYDGLAFSGLTFSTPVTITAANRASRPVLSNFNVNDSQGLTFSGFELLALPGYWSFRITGSKAITLQGLTLHAAGGDLNNAPQGILVQNSPGLTIANSEFSGVHTALSISFSDGLTVRENHFHDLRSDAINVSQAKGVTISGNYIHDLVAVGADHPDAIQMWTGPKGALADIKVQGNLIVKGAPNASPQGLYISDSDGLGLNGVTVTDNLMIGLSYNGAAIMASAARPATGIQILNNRVISSLGGESRIRLDHAAAPIVRGNKALVPASLTGTAALPDSAVGYAPAVGAGGAAKEIAAWRATHPTVPN